MTQREVSAQIASHMIALVAACALVALLSYASTKDDADNRAVCAHVEKQAKAAAQPDTWAKLDRQGRDLVAFDRIGKK